MARKRNDGSSFIQEYLYIEELPFEMIEIDYTNQFNHKTDETQRGVVVIDLLGDEEKN